MRAKTLGAMVAVGLVVAAAGFFVGSSVSWFPCQAQGKTKYKCDIKDKTPAGLYKYRILIKGLSEVDPWVVNY